MIRSFFAVFCLLVWAVDAQAQSQVRLTPPNVTLIDVTCGSAVSSCVLKATNGNFFGIYAECTAACWLMVFNTKTVPSNGATTAGNGSTANAMVECVDIGAGSSRSITYPSYPVAYSTGIIAVISSTACATLTLSTVGFIRGTVN